MKTFLGVLLLGISVAHAATPSDPIVSGRDYHSFADPAAFRVKHLDLDLQASFAEKRLSGVADLTVARVAPDAGKLTLDTRDLTIRQVWWLRGAGDLVPLRFTLGVRDAVLGAPLAIDLPAELNTPEFRVRISYQTRPEASGLQWVTAPQTLDAAFALTGSGNSEISFSWLRIANDYAPAYPQLESYLTTIGRRKLIRPLYEDLMKTPAGAERARAIYARARPNYHPIATATLDGIVLKKAAR